MPALVEVEEVTLGYGDQVVLEQVSLEVAQGEIFGILGGSGCGKSTLLRAMLGLIRPRGGVIRIAGEDIARVHGRRRERLLRQIGVAFQGGALFGSMTLLENVVLPLEEWTRLQPAARELIGRMKLAMVGLTGFEQHLPEELSGGMRKRAAVARALALEPSILMFDEPSAGLDPVTSSELDSLILNLNQALGCTVLIVTHELPSIFAIVDRCILLDGPARGIIATGNPKELREQNQDPRVQRFFRRAGRNDRNDRNDRNHAAGSDA